LIGSNLGHYDNKRTPAAGPVASQPRMHMRRMLHDTTKLLMYIMDEPILYLWQEPNKILFKFTSSPCEYICVNTEIAHRSQNIISKSPMVSKMLSKIVPAPRTLELLAFDEKSIFDTSAPFEGIRQAQFYSAK
jgi:hypothetical protein